jgi:O-antigen/teichoic acid export membrane protein
MVTRELARDDGRSYATNLSAQLIGRMSSVVASLLVFVLIAREFGTERFGQFSLVLTFLSVLIVVADFGTTPALAREISRPKVDRERLWGTFLLLRFALAAIVTLLALVCSSLFRPDLVVLVVVGVLGLPLLASRFFEPVFQVSDRPWYSTRASLTYGLVYLAGVAVAALLLESLFWAVVAYVAANAVYCGVALWLSLRCIRPRFDLRALGMSGLARLAAPLGVGSIFIMVNTRADILMLAYLQSDTAVGLYNAAFRFFDLAAMAAVIVMVPFVPIFSARAARDRAELKALYIRVLEGLGLVILPVAIAVPSFSAGLVSLVFGPDFGASAAVLHVLAWVGVLTFVCHAGSTANLAVGEVRHAYWNAALAAGINIGLNLLWIPRFGILGAAWATLVSEIALLAVSQCYVWKNLGNTFRVGRWLRIATANAFVYAILFEAGAELSLAIRLPAAALGYVTCLLAFGVVVPRDLARWIQLRRVVAVGESQG